MGMASNNQIRPPIGQLLGQFLLLLVGGLLVFHAPVHGNDQIIALRAQGLHIRLYFLLVNQGYGIFLSFWNRNAVGPIGISQKAEDQAAPLNQAGLGRFLWGAKGADHGHSPLSPCLQSVFQPRYALVQGMVCGLIDHVETAIHGGVRRLPRPRRRLAKGLLPIHAKNLQTGCIFMTAFLFGANKRTAQNRRKVVPWSCR